MAKSKQEIISDIDAHIEDCGGAYSSWYVGITEDAERRVFQEHGVVKGKDTYIWRKASSSVVARDVEAHFLDKGCDGGTAQDRHPSVRQKAEDLVQARAGYQMDTIVR